MRAVELPQAAQLLVAPVQRRLLRRAELPHGVLAGRAERAGACLPPGGPLPLLEDRHHGRGALEAVLAALLEQRADQLVEEGREVRLERAAPRGNEIEDVAHHGAHVVGVEGVDARGELVEDEPERVEVGATVQGAQGALELLGGGVLDRARERTRRATGASPLRRCGPCRGPSPSRRAGRA